MLKNLEFLMGMLLGQVGDFSHVLLGCIWKWEIWTEGSIFFWGEV